MWTILGIIGCFAGLIGLAIGTALWLVRAERNSVKRVLCDGNFLMLHRSARRTTRWLDKRVGYLLDIPRSEKGDSVAIALNLTRAIGTVLSRKLSLKDTSWMGYGYHQDAIEKALKDCGIVDVVRIFEALVGIGRQDLWEARHWGILGDKFEAAMDEDNRLQERRITEDEWNALKRVLPNLRIASQYQWRRIAECLGERGHIRFLKEMMADEAIPNAWLEDGRDLLEGEEQCLQEYIEILVYLKDWNKLEYHAKYSSGSRAMRGEFLLALQSEGRLTINTRAEEEEELEAPDQQ